MKRLSLIFATAMAVLSCNTTNPFLTGWDTPYGIPDFAKNAGFMKILSLCTEISGNTSATIA